MITIANGIVLQGYELVAKKTNILIDDGEILEISPDVLEGEIIDATDCIVCPSFLNAHTHIGDSIIKDCGDGKSIAEIVKPPNGIKHIAISEATDDEMIIAMKKSMEFMLETGTTHFIDYREGGLDGVKLLEKAVSDVPINPTILGRDNSFYDKEPDLHQVKIAIRKLLKHCAGIAPSGFGEINDEVAILISTECRKKGKISSIHAGEYEKIQRESLIATGKTEVKRAIDCGFDQIVHVTSPLNDDLDLIAKNNKNLAICPRSNGTLSLGIAPLIEILKKGIKPIIGTDNIMLNSPNIFRELEYTLKTIRAFYKGYISPKEILQMVTSNVLNEVNQLNKDSLKIDKSIIEENNYAELFVAKKLSKNPYLSLINRTETKDIICVSNKDKLLYYN